MKLKLEDLFGYFFVFLIALSSLSCENYRSFEAISDDEKKLRTILGYLSKDSILLKSFNLHQEKPLSKIEFKVAARDISPRIDDIPLDSLLTCFQGSDSLYCNTLSIEKIEKYVKQLKESYQVTEHENWADLSVGSGRRPIVFFYIVNPWLVYCNVMFDHGSNLSYDNNTSFINYRGTTYAYTFCLKNNLIQKAYSARIESN